MPRICYPRYSKPNTTRHCPKYATISAKLQTGLGMLNGFAVDLLNAAMREVNWQEISEHLIADAKEQAKAS